MSRLNVEIVKRVQPSGIDFVDLFRTSTAPPGPSTTGIDLTPFAFDFETEFISSQAGSLRPRFRGFQGFGEAWQDWLEPWESYYIEVEEFIDAGDDVVVLSRVLAKTTPDAVAIEHHPAAVWSLREGKIVRVRFYLEREKALEAVGLSE